MSATTTASADEPRAIIPSNVLLPTPDPAKTPTCWPRPQGSRASMAWTPSVDGRSMRPRSSGCGAATSSGTCSIGPPTAPRRSMGLPNASMTRPASCGDSGSWKRPPRSSRRVVRGEAVGVAERHDDRGAVGKRDDLRTGSAVRAGRARRGHRWHRRCRAPRSRGRRRASDVRCAGTATPRSRPERPRRTGDAGPGGGRAGHAGSRSRSRSWASDWNDSINARHGRGRGRRRRSRRGWRGRHRRAVRRPEVRVAFDASRRRRASPARGRPSRRRPRTDARRSSAIARPRGRGASGARKDRR